MKRIRQGNTIVFHYQLYRGSDVNKVPEDLTGCEISIVFTNRYYDFRMAVSPTVVGNKISATIPGSPSLKTGIYNFAVFYQKDGQDHAIDTDVFEIVDSSSKAGGSTCCPEIQTESIELQGRIEYGVTEGGITEQVQSDWQETNPTSPAFILHKPEIPVLPSGLVVDPAYVHTDNNLTTELLNKLNDLNNYNDTAIERRLINVERYKADAVSIENISVNPADDYTVNASLKPNIFYSLSMVKQLTIELLPPTNTNLYNEYMFMFVSGETPTTLILPSGIKWMNEPTIEANHTYQVSIAFGIAVIGGVSNE